MKTDLNGRGKISGVARAIISMLACFCVIFFLSVPLVQVASATPPNILILHSYSPGYTWSQGITAGIKKTLSTSKLDASFYFEHMETIKYDISETFPVFAKLYEIKYREIPFRLVIAVDDAALSFMLEHGKKIFPGVPVIFCGVNSPVLLRKALASGNTTGVFEDPDVKGTLDLALNFIPGVKKVVFITDSTTSGQINLEKAKQLPGLYPDLSIEFLSGTSIEELKNVIGELRKGTLVIPLAMTRVAIDRPYRAREVAQILAGKPEVFLFSPLETWVRFMGAIGGSVTSSEKIGSAAADIAVRILRGEKVETIRPVLDLPPVTMFDYANLNRIKLTPADLPSGAEIVNEPQSPIWKYRKIIMGSSAFILALAIFSIILGVNVLKRRKLEKDLRTSEERYRLVSMLSSDAAFQARVVSGRIELEWVTAGIEKIFGLSDPVSPENPIPMEEILSYVQQEDRQRVLDSLNEVSSGERVTFDCRIKSLEQKEKWVRFFLMPRPSNSGDVYQFVGSATDISVEKEAEKMLRESVRQKEMFLNETHHRILNNLQILSSLFSLQAESLSDKAVKGLLEDNIARLRVIGMIHTLLLESEDAERIRIDTFVLRLLNNAASVFRSSLVDRVQTDLDLDPVELNVEQAVSIGLVIGEILSNVLRHAFPEGFEKEKRLTFNLKETEEHVSLQITDTGVGLANGIQPRDVDSLGFQMIFTLTEQLGGRCSIESGDTGLSVQVTF